MKSKNQHLAKILPSIDLTKTQSLDTYNQTIHAEYVQSILSRIDHRNEDYVFKNGIVRKYTERECFRFMGFTDKDFDNASSVCKRKDLYQQAGNTIVVQVLENIFKNML
jgi:site-specific DNA-cytosine methylase